MDGLVQDRTGDNAPAYVLCAGLTNRPDRVDEAAKRPGRFSLVLPMPDVSQQSAEDIMAIYARGGELPWYVDGEVRTEVASEVIRSQFLRPALARVFNAVVLRYATDTQRTHDVTAGQILSNAHYMDAMNRAKKRAALRYLRNFNVPAVTLEDVLDCLLDVACEAARQMAADPQMLIRQLDIKVPVARVDIGAPARTGRTPLSQAAFGLIQSRKGALHGNPEIRRPRFRTVHHRRRWQRPDGGFVEGHPRDPGAPDRRRWSDRGVKVWSHDCAGARLLVRRLRLGPFRRLPAAVDRRRPVLLLGHGPRGMLYRGHQVPADVCRAERQHAAGDRGRPQAGSAGGGSGRHLCLDDGQRRRAGSGDQLRHARLVPGRPARCGRTW